MIYITGDTHTKWCERTTNKNFPEQKNLTKNDYLIICGDFGIWSNSKTEQNNIKTLENRNFTTLFVSGNHENYDILDSLPTKEWHGGKVNFISDSVIHLKRGQVFEIDGNTFFTFGGASSHDIQDGILEPTAPNFKRKLNRLKKDPFAMFRINHQNWWERELPNEAEMNEGLKNLMNYNNKVDYIITHSPYTSLVNRLNEESEDTSYEIDRLTDYLETIKNTVEYHYWYFGHIHMNRHFPQDKSECLYKEIRQLYSK